MLVTLTPSELILAANVGIMRQVTNLRDKRRDAYGAQKKDGWQSHIEGATGELAVAKACGRYWSGSLGRLRAADVGRLQVRTTALDRGCLIIHDEDPHADVFVLVTYCDFDFTLRGWRYGGESKEQRWWRDSDRPAYFIPQSDLRPIDIDFLKTQFD